MFYGGSQKIFTSPNLTCKQAYPKRANNYEDEVTGRLDFSATAYAINRLRYDVSLIHDEHKEAEAAPIGATADDFEYEVPDIIGEIVYD